jgi:hypothetical protein
LRFFRGLLVEHEGEPGKTAEDKLLSYNIAQAGRQAGRQAEGRRQSVSEREFRPRPSARKVELDLARLKSKRQVRQLLGARAAVYTLFNLSRLLVSVESCWYWC